VQRRAPSALARGDGYKPGTSKSDAERKVPIPSALRDYLVEQRIRATDLEGLVFGNGATPFSLHRVRDGALAAWKAAGLDPITLHEARHTFASLMIAARVDAKAISSYMGHSSIQITYDRYGHLMPGNEKRRRPACSTPTSTPLMSNSRAYWRALALICLYQAKNAARIRKIGF
jgi:integrase